MKVAGDEVVADGNGGEENGESIPRRAGAGAFGSAGAGFISSRYAAASREAKLDEQSVLDVAADAAGATVVAALMPAEPSTPFEGADCAVADNASPNTVLNAAHRSAECCFQEVFTKFPQGSFQIPA